MSVLKLPGRRFASVNVRLLKTEISTGKTKYVPFRLPGTCAFSIGLTIFDRKNVPLVNATQIRRRGQ